MTHERAAAEITTPRHRDGLPDTADTLELRIDEQVLRSGLADPAPALTDRIGERPSSVFERDEWAAAGAALLNDPHLDLDASLSVEIALDDLALDL